MSGEHGPSLWDVIAGALFCLPVGALFGLVAWFLTLAVYLLASLMFGFRPSEAIPGDAAIWTILPGAGLGLIIGAVTAE